MSTLGWWGEPVLTWLPVDPGLAFSSLPKPSPLPTLFSLAQQLEFVVWPTVCIQPLPSGSALGPLLPPQVLAPPPRRPLPLLMPSPPHQLHQSPNAHISFSLNKHLRSTYSVPSTSPGSRVTSGSGQASAPPEAPVLRVVKLTVDALRSVSKVHPSTRPLTCLVFPSFRQRRVLALPRLCPLPSSQALDLGVTCGATALPRSPLALQVPMCPKPNILPAARPHSVNMTTVHPVGQLAASRMNQSPSFSSPSVPS